MNNKCDGESNLLVKQGRLGSWNLLSQVPNLCAITNSQSHEEPTYCFHSFSLEMEFNLLIVSKTAFYLQITFSKQLLWLIIVLEKEWKNLHSFTQFWSFSWLLSDYIDLTALESHLRRWQTSCLEGDVGNLLQTSEAVTVFFKQ